MNKIKPYDYILKPGYIFLPDGPAILGAVLGIGVVVTIFDINKKKGGMCHFTRPEPPKIERGSAIYGAIAVPALLNLFLERGSNIVDLKAHIIGGANKTNGDRSEKFSESPDFGEENIQVAEKVFKKYQIKKVAYSKGGYQGKKVLYNSFTDELFYASINKIRKSDWE